ncbi:MAG: aminobutyraldehyde dehydrogenase [Actinomycetota bacterium]|nr:aminobutyraldehyde dehydrogenase [Actinomycetota bacterium]
MDAGLLIDGHRATGTGPARRLTNPADGSFVAEVGDASADQVSEAVASARAAMESWGETTPRERSEVLFRLAELIERRADELVALEVAETGKPVTVARDGELPFALDNLRFFAGAARSLAGTGAARLSPGYTSLLLRRPVGVVGAIAPWNFPTIMALWKAGPALAAGCTVVLKPSPQTPRTAARLAELGLEAGLPPGAWNVITGGADVGMDLVAHPDVAMVTLTGSTETGRAVMAGAAPTLKRLHLELGGKAPLLVFSDADVERAASAAALGGTYNSGQDCTAATRVYVERTRFDETVDALHVALTSIQIGDPQDPSTDIGPLIGTDHRERVHGFVRRAADADARIVCGGRVPDGPGAYYPPTLVVGAGQRSEVVQSEVFGPVLVALPFDDEDEAVRLANDVEYGLASSIWTGDIGRAFRVMHRLEFGVTWINDHLPIASEAPHGGLKGSGFGTDLSQQVILEYSVGRHVMIRHDEPPERTGFRPA